MKLNNKGFMMAEVIVVSAIVLVTIAGMYTSYNKIYSIYKNRISYYDVNTLYRLSFFRDIMVENEIISENANQAKNNSDKIIDNTSSFSTYVEPDVKERIFTIYNNKKSISSNIFNNIANVNPTFKDYVDYLKETVDNFNEFNYMMIIERCQESSKDKCTYAYLEIFDSMLN